MVLPSGEPGAVMQPEERLGDLVMLQNDVDMPLLVVHLRSQIIDNPWKFLPRLGASGVLTARPRNIW